MANETNDFLTDWAAAAAPAPGGEDGGNDTGDDGGAVDDLGGEDGGGEGGGSADNGATGNDGDVSPTAGDDHSGEGQEVPLVALRNERRAKQEERTKREAAEKRVKELEEQLKAPARRPENDQGQPQQRETAPPKDFWEDPVGFVQQQVQAVRQEYEARANHQQQMEFRRMEGAMRRQHADFDEISQIVQEEAARNPAIVPAIFQAENPAEKLYELGKQIRDFREFQTDPKTARDKMREELKAEILAELKGSAAPANNGAQPATRRPVDLSRQRNATSASAAAPPDQFNELFRRG